MLDAAGRARAARSSGSIPLVTVYLARRLVIFAISLFVASVVVFVVLSVLPGDPAEALLGTRASPQALHQLRHQLGLDRPLWVRYRDWATGLVHGDFGVSAVSQAPVAPQIGDELEVTGPLALLSLLLALAIAVPTGVLAALRHRKPSGTAISAASQIGIAIPEFWAGILLITLVSVRLGWLPAGSFPGWSQSVGGSLRHLILPVIALALVQAAVFTRYIRSAVLEVLREDFMRTARAGGLTLAGALRRHGVRNAASPIVTLLGLQIAGLLAGAVVIEKVFDLHGLGQALLDGIFARDTLLVQDITMLLTATVLIVNLLVDLSYRLLDPRLRGAAR
jgi:peptide/nickel transport system permease protein